MRTSSGRLSATQGKAIDKLITNSLGAISDLRSGESIGASDLDARVAVGAAALAARGIGPGDFVMIVHGDSIAFFVDLLAVWRRGACAVCTNPGSSARELEALAAFAEPTLILVREDGATDVSSTLGAITIPRLDLSQDPAAQVTGEQGVQMSSPKDDPALILFTSGSTGLPKGVVHSFRSLGARIALNRQHIGPDDMASSLCVLPTHFGHGLIGNCLTPLSAGCDLFLMSGDAMRAAGRLGTVIDDNAITFMSSVPAFWRLALKASRRPNKQSLRRVHIGSAPLSADLWNEVIAWTGTQNVVNMYGLTETANWVAGASARDHVPQDGLIGELWGGEAAIVDGCGKWHETGGGELVLRTPSCMSGYLKQPDLTGSSLRDGWLYTGDIGRIDDGGTLRLTGRKRTEINRAGIKVHPEEVDLLIERHPAVAEVCTFGVPDAVAGEIVGVAVRLEDGNDVTEQELRSWCSHQIRREARPDRWFFVSQIPRTERGKVNRLSVRQACLGEPTKSA